jgi:hypothetical protein
LKLGSLEAKEKKNPSLSGVYLPAPFRVAVSTVLDIYRWLEAPI